MNQQKTKKLWNQTVPLNEAVEKFTVGNDRQLDLHLARWDVIGSLAHARMLLEVGLLKKADWQAIHQGLLQILKAVDSGRFKIDDGVEDVHSQVELLLGEAGKRLHLGRSRNDQVLVDLKLFTRQQIKEIVQNCEQLFEQFIAGSEKHRQVFIPGYTHLQVAMPSSIGLWLGAYAESLVDDLVLLHAAYQLVNSNPLGSAAGYGSTFPLDRQRTTELLGFDQLNVNALYAQMGRGKMERAVAQAIAGLAETLSRFATDAVLFQSQNFGFIHFPASITTGSSIMPHKKNPDVFEVLRARCNRLKSLPNEIQMLTTNLPSGYHRDLQLVKERYIPALLEINECLSILKLVLPEMRVRTDVIKEEKYKYAFSVEAVNHLVQKGVPFRDAYRQVAQSIEEGRFKKPQNLQYTHVGSPENLRNDLIRAKMQAVGARFNFKKWESAIEALLSD